MSPRARTFVGAIGADIAPERLLGAVGASASLHDAGRLRIAHDGAPIPAGCLLDGTVDRLEDVAALAGVDPTLAPEQLLAAAYARIGDRLLPHLRGAFALVLWDPALPDQDVVTLARDHIGGEGLVWTRSTGGIVFASEVADLLAALPRTPSPDEVALAHWLTVSGMPEDRTLFAGVRRVRAGHRLRIEKGVAEAERWWKLAIPPPAPALLPHDEAVGRVREVLGSAVTRAIDDGGADRTAVLLSGGLDSSAVAVFAADRVKATCSAVFPTFPRADETALIDTTLQTLGLRNIRATVGPDSGIVDGALEYIERWLLPPVSPNLFFWLPLLRVAREQGIDVVLDGQGGDEVFGLTPFVVADRLRRGDIMGAVRIVSTVPGVVGTPPPKAVARWLLRFGVRGALPAGLAEARRRFTKPPGDGAPAWLAPRIARAAVEVEPPQSWKHNDGPRWFAHLVSMTLDGMGPALAYDHIRRRDGLVGMRTRHPIADPDVIATVLGLAPEHAFDARYTRPLLRDSIAGRLPESVRLRKGKGDFDGPFHAALAGPDLPIAQALLGDPHARVGGYLAAPALARELLRAPAPGERQTWALYLWRTLTAEVWLRTLEDSKFPDRLRESGLSRGNVNVTSSLRA